MKKILTFIIPIIIIVLIPVIWVKPVIQETPISSTDPVAIPVKKDLVEVIQKTEFKQLTEEEKLNKVYSVLDQLPPEYQRLKHQYKIALSSLPNVTFYGRVIDQYGQPVVNAKVWYEGTSTYLSAGGGRGASYTDELGYFEIDTVGNVLSLGGITHPEIEYSYPQVQEITYSDSATYSRLKTSINLSSNINSQTDVSWRNYAEKDKAYVIQAWRLSKYEGTINGRVNGYYNLTGDVYTLNLFGKTYEQKILEGEKEGHLRVNCTRKIMEDNMDYGNWTATITPINGGIQETDDVYMNKAPESGYQSSLHIDMRKDSMSYQPTILNKRYFFKSNNGKEYGSLYVHFWPHSKFEDNTVCRVDIKSYKINPTGSRNLELKKEKISQPVLRTEQNVAYRA